MLTAQEKTRTQKELIENYNLLHANEQQVISDLCFTKAQLDDALHVCRKGIASPSDLWKLRDYLEEQINKQGSHCHPFTVLRPEYSKKFAYQRTWV